VLEVNSLGCPS